MQLQIAHDSIHFVYFSGIPLNFVLTLDTENNNCESKQEVMARPVKESKGEILQRKVLFNIALFSD